MKLYPKDYVAPAADAKPTKTSEDVRAEVIALVKSFVDVPREYDEIVKHIETARGLGDIVDVVALIDEVRDEWHPVAVKPEVIEK